MSARIIDLTHLLNEQMQVYPDTPPPSFEVTNTVYKDGYTEHRISMPSHTGTHIDAPHHILQDAKPLDKFPLEKFTGRAIVIDCLGRDEISLEYLQLFEDKIVAVEFILFFTGWQNRWNTEKYFENCPVPTREAAEWMTTFNLKGVGVDAFSLDKINSALNVSEDSLPNHYIFLRKEILLIENLTNLDKLQGHIFTFQCFPIKVENADGSPVRAVAMFEPLKGLEPSTC